MEAVRWIAFISLLLFSVYTIYAIRTENFWQSVKTVLGLRWGKQVVIDLYLGLFLFNFIIYLNEGSFIVMLGWLVPTLILGNIVPLLYLIISFPTFISHF